MFVCLFVNIESTFRGRIPHFAELLWSPIWHRNCFHIVPLMTFPFVGHLTNVIKDRPRRKLYSCCLVLRLWKLFSGLFHSSPVCGNCPKEQIMNPKFSFFVPNRGAREPREVRLHHTHPVWLVRNWLFWSNAALFVWIITTYPIGPSLMKP